MMFNYKAFVVRFLVGSLLGIILGINIAAWLISGGETLLHSTLAGSYAAILGGYILQYVIGRIMRVPRAFLRIKGNKSELGILCVGISICIMLIQMTNLWTPALIASLSFIFIGMLSVFPGKDDIPYFWRPIYPTKQTP